MNDFDSRGRNLKEQRSRQNKVPWVKVKYTRGKIIIPYEIKNLINVYQSYNRMYVFR